MNSDQLVHRTHHAHNEEQHDPILQLPQSKPPTPIRSLSTNPIRYMLREQRLLFVLIGVAIAALFFSAFPLTNPELASSLSSPLLHDPTRDPVLESGSVVPTRRVLLEGLGSMNVGGKVPLGLKSKSQRIVVTGGAGFVGSHLVDRLIARGDSVIVIDNFFTGRKENLAHHFGNPKFELIRHDVVEPILLEVDQIYHLACPASPVHYKFNPVKTIISFLN